MKKVKYIVMAIMMFLVASPVYADITCKKIEIDDKIPKTVSLIVFFLQVAVPVLLVIFGSIDLVKAVTSGKEDEIKKAQTVFIRRLITGLLVFFVVVVVKLIFNFANSDDKANSKTMWNCAACFINGPKHSSCKNS